MKTIILDTETSGSFAKPAIFDLSYLIVDNTHIIKQQSFLIRKTNVKTAWCYNSEIYNERLKNHEIKIVSFRKAFKTLLKDMKKYNIHIINGYNVSFDKRALYNTCKMYRINSKKLDLVQFHDILADTKQKLKDNPYYMCYCMDNNYTYKKHNSKYTFCKFNAECVGRFVIKGYKEQHVALDDCFLEYIIYLNYSL